MRFLTSAIAAAVAALTLLPVSASAKPHQHAGVSYSGNMTMAGRVAGSYKTTRKAKKSAARSSKRRGASKTSYRSSKRGSVKRRSAKGRSFTRYARKGGGASASAGCLTPAARNLLGRIRGRFGNVQVISTCRPGARIAGSGKVSRHASGNAIDFRVPGKKAAVIAWLRANHRNGGIMTYRDMDHVHVDIGPRFVALGRPSGRT